MKRFVAIRIDQEREALYLDGPIFANTVERARRQVKYPYFHLAEFTHGMSRSRVREEYDKFLRWIMALGYGREEAEKIRSDMTKCLEKLV